MRSFQLVTKVLASSFVVAAVVSVSAQARAAEPPKPAADSANKTATTSTTSARVEDQSDAPTVGKNADADKVQKPGEDETHFRPLAITANPLSLALGRYGLNVEYMLATHHGIMLNPYGQFTSAEGGNSKTSYKNLGAELGYHFYTGHKGANGFFIGPSLLYMHSSSDTTVTGGGASVGGSSSFDAYGLAVDLGGQHVFDNGITVGGGVGLMYLKSSMTGESGATSSTVKFDGVLPRFLAMAGYSF